MDKKDAMVEIKRLLDNPQVYGIYDKTKEALIKAIEVLGENSGLEKELAQCRDCSGYCLYLKQEIKKLKDK